MSAAEVKRRCAVVLGLLAFAFFLRVLGQSLVAAGAAGWLPPMSEWYSGLMPYPLLLPTQLVMLAVQAKISRDLWSGTGFFARPGPAWGWGLVWFSYIY